MDESDRVRQAALEVAAAIERRDVSALAAALAPGFVHRSPGGESQGSDMFLQAIADIPGEIVFVRLVELEVDVSGAGAVATGIQHAQVRIDGQEIEDRRAFVDWFVADEGRWKIRVAVDLPVPPAPVS